jgi:hypothetical protein
LGYFFGWAVVFVCWVINLGGRGLEGCGLREARDRADLMGSAS